MLNRSTVQDVLCAALSTGGDFAEVFVESKNTTVINMIGGRIEKANAGHDFGIGIRVFSGTNSVYTYTNNSEREHLIQLTRNAVMSLKGQSQVLDTKFYAPNKAAFHKIDIYPADVLKSDKVALLKKGYEAAASYNELISQVTGFYLDWDQNVLIANSEGVWAEDRRVRTRCGLSAVASKNGEMQTGGANVGAHSGFELYNTHDMAHYGREAARIASAMIEAEYCPSGQMPVVIDNGFGGVIFHEACGHGLEATAIAKGTSVFTGKMGQQIANPVVTAFDDGTAENQWGSAAVDDEGNPTQKTLLIENGVLKNYLVDKLNGRRMDAVANGCARRESYRYEPTSRMSNTYIAPGKSTPDEIISGTEYGLYAKTMGGGSVNPATGEFNFAVQEGYIIRNGKIAEPVRGATLIGTGFDTLTSIDMVGNNLKMGQGMCGSLSGSIPANVGQPMVRVSKMTVGGRKRGE